MSETRRTMSTLSFLKYACPFFISCGYNRLQNRNPTRRNSQHGLCFLKSDSYSPHLVTPMTAINFAHLPFLSLHPKQLDRQLTISNQEIPQQIFHHHISRMSVVISHHWQHHYPQHHYNASDLNDTKAWGAQITSFHFLIAKQDYTDCHLIIQFLD